MLALLAAGSVFFPGLFLLSKQTLKHMMGWREGDAAIVSTRLVSSIQAVMASSAGCIIASSCRDVVEDSHWLTDTYILFATPYFAYDIYAMFLCYWHKLQVKGHEEEEEEGGVRSMGAAVAGYLRRELLMVLHHVFMVAFCFPASLLWRQGKGDFFQGVLFLAELSTPSVCLGKVLIQYKKQHTLLHKVNGGVMLLTFFSCRVLLFPYLYYAYSRHAAIPVYAVPLVAPWQCNLGAALLWPLQLYWFTLICRGALRLFIAGRSNSPLPTFKAERAGCLTPSNGCTSHREDGPEGKKKTGSDSNLQYELRQRGQIR
ncbi:ceramide synthase-like [Siniperca chuatsi]|uniref:ceramide synthase-like n=1 Tax=Siniperca chuatsi TaxID=119488 RepID=UPI001CE19F51|nr:ceramide synthase-like [Siniperca chuatsi]